MALGRAAVAADGKAADNQIMSSEVPGPREREPWPAQPAVPEQPRGLSAATARSAFQHVPTAMAVLSVPGVVEGCNPALTDLLGRPADQLLGSTLVEVVHPEDVPGVLDRCQQLRVGGSSVVRHECRLLQPDGAVRWVVASTARVPDSDQHPAHLVMHLEDITERKALEDELTHRALHDPLTGLANRTLLMDRITHALARGRRAGTSTCLFFIDLDGFKAVNDTYGHDAGDELLRHVADRLRALLRPGDTAARLGGDEFAVLCEDLDPPQAAVVARRLRRAAATPFRLAGHAVTLSAAVGTGTAPPVDPAQPALDAAGLLREADQDMYAAKRDASRG